ncbi:MAG: hypothetical protein K6E51_06815 [Treponema sp.]|nr:hypothetical protein [Treponema sp.]
MFDAGIGKKRKSQNALLEYDYVAALLQLKKIDKPIDMRLLKDSFQDMKDYIGRTLDPEHYIETKIVHNGILILSELPVISIISAHAFFSIGSVAIKPDQYTVDTSINGIRFSSDRFNNHQVEISYTAGFRHETFPDDMKEAVLALFIKKHSMYKSAADYAEGDSIDDILEQKFDDGIIDFDEFFGKFSSIPYDVKALLAKYKRIDSPVAL